MSELVKALEGIRREADGLDQVSDGSGEYALRDTVSQLAALVADLAGLVAAIHTPPPPTVGEPADASDAAQVVDAIAAAIRDAKRRPTTTVGERIIDGLQEFADGTTLDRLIDDGIVGAANRSVLRDAIAAAIRAAERQALERAVDLLRKLSDMQTDNTIAKALQFAAFNVRNMILPS